MPRYCSRCILPDSRPGVKLDASDVCAGCRNARAKALIDWDARAVEFQKLTADARARGGSYDCVIPVSGGKDSFWQVVTCLEHGLRPLCVTYVYPGRTALGAANLAALVALGVDHRELRLPSAVERRFVEKAFRNVGISGLVSHMAIYSWPIQVAVTEHIPLVVYGENSAFEYGTDDESLTGARVDRRWLRRFGVTAGTTVEDWYDRDLTPEVLAALVLPGEDLLEAREIRVIFLGYYHRWDPRHSLETALRYGFRARSGGARVGHYDFVNIDDDMIGVHHHPKWHKFGLTRTWDTLSMEIRFGRLTRNAAIEFLRQRGDETPWEDIRVFCEYLGMAPEEYFGILEGFRNHDLWTHADAGWRIDDFLIPDYGWPSDMDMASKIRALKSSIAAGH
jgi:N-acetyl sugar amidotransferase